ncbi:MAG: AAA family ATPase [Actinomycetota bacterium]|nr:AAA family ATPase [Actinomycetota bacterium]
MTDPDCVDCVADDELAEQEARWQYELAEMETSTNGQRDTRHGDGVDADLRDLLDAPEPAYDWKIPNLIEALDRVFLTGGEGDGKTTLLRQLTLQAAAGIHPFTLENIDPLRVLYVDLENSIAQNRRAFRPLAITVGDRLARRQLIPIIEPSGIDLLHRHGVDWLTERVDRNEPDLLIAGPVYKLANGDPTSEEMAKAVSAVLDDIRTTYGCAVIIEGHSPYGSGGKRPIRPYGASLWSRWPEFGLHLSKQGQLLHWRGARDERNWPAALKRGGEWPWTPEIDKRAITFAAILEEVHAQGRRLSERDLADALNAPKTTIHRAIQANQTQFDTACEEVDQ